MDESFLADLARAATSPFEDDDDRAYVASVDDPPCTCTYAAYAKIGGGTGFDIAHYDPACPEHGDDDLEEARAVLYGVPISSETLHHLGWPHGRNPETGEVLL